MQSRLHDSAALFNRRIQKLLIVVPGEVSTCVTLAMPVWHAHYVRSTPHATSRIMQACCFVSIRPAICTCCSCRTCSTYTCTWESQVGTQVLQTVIRYLTCEACIALASVLVKGHRYTYFGLVRCPLDENNSSPQNHEHTGILNNH